MYMFIVDVCNFKQGLTVFFPLENFRFRNISKRQLTLILLLSLNNKNSLFHWVVLNILKFNSHIFWWMYFMAVLKIFPCIHEYLLLCILLVFILQKKIIALLIYMFPARHIYLSVKVIFCGIDFMFKL